jgi:hypothetical protein
MNKTTQPEKKPWRREPMVWMLIAVPAAAVVMGVITLTLAIRSYDGLVSDDYYKRGLEINRAIERDARAAQLGLAAEIELLGAERRLRVKLHAGSGFAAPPELMLKFAYALQGREDHELVLMAVGGSDYSAELPALVPGRWYLQLTGADWRLNGVVRLPEETRARLASAR